MAKPRPPHAAIPPALGDLFERFRRPVRLAFMIVLSMLTIAYLVSLWVPFPGRASAAPAPDDGVSGTLGATFSTAMLDARPDASWPEAAPGAAVETLVASGPAALAGLRVGDRIVALDGAPIADACALDAALRERAPGDKTALDVRRGRSTTPITLDVVLAHGPTLLGRLCADGQLDACTTLALLPEHARGTSEVAAELERACDGGEPHACAQIAGRLVSSNDPKSVPRGAELARKACDGGSASGCTHLAYLYATGRGVDQDDARATALYETGCDGGDAAACFNVGLNYEKQRGVPRNDARALRGYVRGCEGGFRPACANLGFLWDRGIGMVENAERAATLYERACTSTACDPINPLGCLNLGVFLREGRGRPQDLARAADLFGLACEQGIGAACNNLGVMTERGEGIAADPARGRDLYRRACDFGSENGCRNAAAADDEAAGAPGSSPAGERWF